MAPSWKKVGAVAIITAAITTSTISRASADEFDASSYVRNASLGTDLDLFWTIDPDLQTIRVAVHAKAASGWAGFGVSEMGGMEGADIVYYEAAAGSITDAHAIVAGTPVTDVCTQDWTLLSAEKGTDGLVFEVERALETGDSQDRAFTDDSAEGASSTTLIAAWGNTESISYHESNFAQGQVIMFGGVENSNSDPLLGISSSPSVSFFDITAKNFTIPRDRTWYEDTYLLASELPTLDEYHVIGFEAIVQNTTSKYVHHLVLAACTGTDDCGQACAKLSRSSGYYSSSSSSSSLSNTSLSNTSSTSTRSISSAASDVSTEYEYQTSAFCDFEFTYIFIWAPGVADEQLPKDVGFKFGSASGGYTSLQLETHYNNVDGDEGVMDSSGIRVYYTSDLRPIDMGVLSLGDPSVWLGGFPIPEGKSSILFECPGSCTADNFEVDNVTVYGHFLHAHENGRRIITRQYRQNKSGDEVLVHTAEVEYYSFLQAGGYVVKTNDSVTIQRGDRFETECYYDTVLSSISQDSVTFGAGSQDEMCIDFMYYYPKQDIPLSGACGIEACGGFMKEYLALDDDSDFSRSFGISAQCEEESSASTLPALSSLVLTVSVTFFALLAIDAL
ncbi:unnamed protein product [Ascophyllum nodosum]